MAKYRKYDPTVIELIRVSRNPKLFPHLNIPRSTAMGWIKSERKSVKVKDTGLEIAYEKRIRDLEK
mgnify:CR=1 FL=1